MLYKSTWSDTLANFVSQLSREDGFILPLLNLRKMDRIWKLTAANLYFTSRGIIKDPSQEILKPILSVEKLESSFSFKNLSHLEISK